MPRFAILTGAGGRRFVGERVFGQVVATISRRSGTPVNSHARDEAAKAQLHAIGLHTQAEVIALHAAGVPGFGPANPVKGTTHCRYNDGVAYRFWPWGFRLPSWARGIDVQPGPGNRDRDRFCAEARALGYTVTATYPSSIGEAQHVNFRKKPRLNWWVLKPVRRGMRAPKGSRARNVIWLLQHIRRPETGVPLAARSRYLELDLKTDHVGRAVEQAIARFQGDHGQKGDGVVGVHTIRSLRATFRRQQAQLKGDH